MIDVTELSTTRSTSPNCYGFRTVWLGDRPQIPA
jgi:hypothetical protein